jgi:lysophospholipase L1-like esterase
MKKFSRCFCERLQLYAELNIEISMMELRKSTAFVLLLSGSVLVIALTACGSGYHVVTPFGQSINRTTVFIGDSITAYWSLPDHNAGIPSQTTGQMLNRFASDVLGHRYERVVILGGTNDTRLNSFASSEVVENLSEMTAIAQSAGIEVILCTVPPNFSEAQSEERVVDLNQQIVALAAAKGLILVDYFSVLEGRPDYFIDGVHPNEFGYAAMETELGAKVTQ